MLEFERRYVLIAILVAIYRQGTLQAMTLVRTRIGRETMDALGGLVAEMRGRERQLNIEQTNEWLNIHPRQRVLSIVTTSANVLLIDWLDAL